MVALAQARREQGREMPSRLQEAAAALEAAEAIRATAALSVNATQPCPECARTVLVEKQPATGFIAKCGRRLTDIDQCRAEGCPASALSGADGNAGGQRS
jgi:hypothetical protein